VRGPVDDDDDTSPTDDDTSPTDDDASPTDDDSSPGDDDSSPGDDDDNDNDNHPNPDGRIIFEEHWDTYSSGTYIGSEGWNMCFNAQSDPGDWIVTNAQCFSSPNSAQVAGEHPGNWAGWAYKGFSPQSGHLLFRANIRASGESSGVQYCDIDVGFDSSTNCNGNSGGYPGVSINSPGNSDGQGIWFGPGNVRPVSTYGEAINIWWDVAIEVNPATLTAYYWLDGAYVGQGDIASLPESTAVVIGSCDGKGWVDDIVIKEIDDDTSPADDDDDSSPA
jgi:hypothetical protein